MLPIHFDAACDPQKLPKAFYAIAFKRPYTEISKFKTLGYHYCQQLRQGYGVRRNEGGK